MQINEYFMHFVGDVEEHIFLDLQNHLQIGNKLLLSKARVCQTNIGFKEYSDV